MIDFLLERFAKGAEKPAIIWGGKEYSYGWLLDRYRHWVGWLVEQGIGDIVSIEGDFSPESVSLLLALINQKKIIVPLSSSVAENKKSFREIAQVQDIISLEHEEVNRSALSREGAGHALLLDLVKKGHPGLVLFSSGSTGASKAALHDFIPLLEKFKVERFSKRTLSFLLFDHIGGVNTLLYTLSNTGCLVTVDSRSPDEVCAAIAKYKVQILPTSPTFINLLILSEAYKRHDLSSLELVTYGTEVMPESTLSRFSQICPAKLQQTYGLSELGILRSKSKSNDSLLVKIGGEGFETRVVDGLLEIKAKSAMLGYLNSPSPFTDDGWFKTGDQVEVHGEYFRILGRRSELINVGGEKVYPAEVESVLLTMDNVEDVSVCGVANPITGKMVFAKVKLSKEEPLVDFKKRMRAFCNDKLEPFKIPQKVELVGHTFENSRFKKIRAST